MQEPLDESCRLEGLLQTIASRGKDLEGELEKNRKIEEFVQKQLEETLKEEPNHPVITEVPVIHQIYSVPSAEFLDQHPSTPKSNPVERQDLRTPDSIDSTEVMIENRLFGGPRELDGNQLTRLPLNTAFPTSPNSIDNSDINAPGLLSYRRNTSSEDLNQFIGCGAAFMTDGSHLFGAVNASSADFIPGLALEHDGRLDAENALANGDSGQGSPKLTSSFDAVDFRTGLSGHRGLGNPKSKSKASSSPTPRRQIRMMGEHRGLTISSARGLTSSGPRVSRQRGAGTTLGPRFSPMQDGR